MKYMLLIYSRESEGENVTPEQLQMVMDEYNAYSMDLVNRKAMVSAEALEATKTATTVRVRDGKRVSTDGPFAETKEQLGGYYIVECKNLDEAIEWAAKCPGAKWGSVEVRPVIDFSQQQ